MKKLRSLISLAAFLVECHTVSPPRTQLTTNSSHPALSHEFSFTGSMAQSQISQKRFSVVIPEDIEKLHQVAIELGKRPNYEGRLFLEFKLGGFRQYVALTIAHSLFGGFSAAESIDFI